MWVPTNRSAPSWIPGRPDPPPPQRWELNQNPPTQLLNLWRQWPSKSAVLARVQALIVEPFLERWSYSVLATRRPQRQHFHCSEEKNANIRGWWRGVIYTTKTKKDQSVFLEGENESSVNGHLRIMWDDVPGMKPRAPSSDSKRNMQIQTKQWISLRQGTPGRK